MRHECTDSGGSSGSNDMPPLPLPPSKRSKVIFGPDILITTLIIHILK